jgi:hypothetical protein
MEKWTKIGINFLDDGLVCVCDYEKALLLRNEVKQNVFRFQHRFCNLGAILNSRDGIIMVSEERIDKAKLTASQLLHDL